MVSSGGFCAFVAMRILLRTICWERVQLVLGRLLCGVGCHEAEHLLL
jgi:hypothetical protein